MLLVLKETISGGERDSLKARLASLGAVCAVLKLGGREAWSLQGGMPSVLDCDLLPGVERVIPPGESFFLASRSFHPASTQFSLGPAAAGGKRFLLAAGPCAVESQEQMSICAQAAKAAGAAILRGGSFKPRTSPYSFQGLGAKGLEIHRSAADSHGLLMMSEVLDRQDLPVVSEIADILQVGSRNMQNFPLLKALGQQKKPVLLKRGLAATREEFLLAAEYILAEGNERVMLCERGVRSFDPALRHTLDLGSVVLLKEMTHLPVLVDPSHAAGRRELVLPMARAAAAAGADGLMVEIHPDPANALSDGPQALLPGELMTLRADLERILPVTGKSFGGQA